MTDAELNEAVARARGFTVETTIEECSSATPGARWQGEYYACEVTWCIPADQAEAWRDDRYEAEPVPDVANDPAAWGALLAELATEERMPLLMWGANWHACVWRDGNTGMWETDPTPGRALALAFLKAVQR